MKPEKKEMVENLCLQMAQRGQLTEKVSIYEVCLSDEQEKDCISVLL